MVGVLADDTPDGQPAGHSTLLVRRHRYTRTLSFYRCWSPAPRPLPIRPLPVLKRGNRPWCEWRRPFAARLALRRGFVQTRAPPSFGTAGLSVF